jgi:NADH:ubiquinone oxidoreductase subunit F (NADH-binding)
VDLDLLVDVANNIEGNTICALVMQQPGLFVDLLQSFEMNLKKQLKKSVSLLLRMLFMASAQQK